MADEHALIKRLESGDRDGLREIYETYKNEMVTIATCLLSDVSAAEDCLQDVFVGLAGDTGRIQIRSSLKGYLVTSIANRARDLLRKRKRKTVAIGDVAEPAGAESTPAEQMSEKEESRHLRAVLATLPYEQREVIVLHLQGRMTFKEIATDQAVSINTAQSRYRYGIEKLRRMLSNEVTA